MNLRLTLVLVILCATFISPAYCATLFGGIQHNERLPAVNESYQPEAPTQSMQQSPMQYQMQSQQGMMGQTGMVPEPPGAVPEPFGLQGSAAQAAAPPQQNGPRIEWYQIPPWMAGKWVKPGDLTESVTDLRTGITTPVNRFVEDYVPVTWGHQVDKHGNIWHANAFPFERDGSSRGQQVRFIIVALKAHIVAPNEIVSRTHSIIVESQYGNVTKIFQQESLNNYVFTGKDIENRSSNRDFTYEGSPLRDGMLLSTFKKVAPFVPVPTLAGVDLARALDDYLRSINLQ